MGQKFESAYKHKPRTSKNQREFAHKMEALGTSTDALLKALKEKGMTSGNLANLYRESRSLKNWIHNHLSLVAFIGAAVVALVVFIPFLFFLVLSHHSPSATPPPRVVPDTTVVDTLQSDSAKM
jgi:predicted PurR-regulated permease PerM